MSREKKRVPVWKLLGLTILAAVIIGFIGAAVYIGVRISDEKEDRVMAAPVSTELEPSPKEEKKDAPKPTAKPVAQKFDGTVTTGDVSDLVDSVMPAVVMIECKSTYKYFSIFGGAQVYEGKSSGTGFIIGQNGDELLIATNNHVIEDNEGVTITFFDGKTSEATVKGTDKYYDLAVLSVDMNVLEENTRKNIKIAVICGDEEIQVGSMAIAIGNSLGYGQSLTVGYISALDRTVKVDNREMKLLQTDAAINPGNSGGPLLNVRGEVIGINSVKFADSSVEGMGYAIPMNMAVPVINELMNRVELLPDEIGYVGIRGTDVTDAYSRAFGMPVGIYVSSVDKGSPAMSAGISVGDVIVEIDGRKITTMEDYKDELKYKKAGTTIELVLMSVENGEYTERSVSVVLGKRPK